MESFKELHNALLLEKKLLGKNGKINVLNTPTVKARTIAEEIFEKNGMVLDDVIPNFDRNYAVLQNLLGKHTLGVSRYDMPVIMSGQIKGFMDALKRGEIDVKNPFAKGTMYTPIDLDKNSGVEWLSLGVKDGNIKDDKIKAALTKRAVGNLKPVQNEIWLDKILNNMIEFGVPTRSSLITKKTIIVSKEGYITDGHHRYATVLLADPKIKLSVLYVPLDIKTLLKVGRSYGNALGNKQRR